MSHLRGKQIKILSGLENESLDKFKIFILLIFHSTYYNYFHSLIFSQIPPPPYLLKLM